MNYLLYVNPLFPYGIVTCSVSAGQTAAEVAAIVGVTNPADWAGFSSSDVPASVFNFSNSLSIVNNLPEPNTVAVNLPGVKASASQQEKAEYAQRQREVLEGYSTEAVAGQASLAIGSRIPAIQAVIVAINALSDTLTANLAAIAAATTVDEVNNIVNPPTGILSTGRGGDGDGPLDLNNSFYTEFNSASLTEAETELYIPGTSTVITYGAVVPNGFTSNGNCFILGDYQVQIREVATSQVIAEFECPLAVAANVDVAF